MLPDYRVRQRDFLLGISRAITAQLDLHEVLRRVVNASVAMLAGQVGLVALRDADGEYHIQTSVGVANEHQTRLNDELRDLLRAAEAGLEQKAVDARFHEMMTTFDDGLQQYIALPLVFAREPLGVLVVFRSYQGSPTPDDVQILESFADQAAIAVHNAQLYARIDQERKRMSAIVQHSADGVMILDSNLRVLLFNSALERITGWTARDAIGLYQEDVIIWDRLDVDVDLKTAVEMGDFADSPSDAAENLYVEGDLQRRDGMTISVGITYAALFNPEGQLTNIIANVRDITNFRQAQEMQSVFISTISHELKTPVAIIKGYAGTLNRHDANWNPDVVRNGLEVIEDESDRLTALIENLLTASKLQAQGRFELNLDTVRLDQLAARAVERLASQTTRHEFALNFPPDFPTIQGDEARLRQVVDNLLSNAIKYAPDGGQIEAGGYAGTQNVTVYIRDEGVGLTQKDQARIFDRFYRVDGALSRKTQGAGLGLYLAKAIIEAHGGEMRVESQPGEGTTFFFTIPL